MTPAIWSPYVLKACSRPSTSLYRNTNVSWLVPSVTPGEFGTANVAAALPADLEQGGVARRSPGQLLVDDRLERAGPDADPLAADPAAVVAPGGERDDPLGARVAAHAVRHVVAGAVVPLALQPEDLDPAGRGAGRPAPADPEEPARVGEAVAELGLEYAVITSVDRVEIWDSERYAAYMQEADEKLEEIAENYKLS